MDSYILKRAQAFICLFGFFRLGVATCPFTISEDGADAAYIDHSLSILYSIFCRYAKMASRVDHIEKKRSRITGNVRFTVIGPSDGMAGKSKTPPEGSSGDYYSHSSIFKILFFSLNPFQQVRGVLIIRWSLSKTYPRVTRSYD